ncbi:MAG: S9 family peptidase [Nocardioidaceae bacterium]
MTDFHDYRPSRRLYPTLAISPDGSRIAYCDDRNGQFNLVVAPIDGEATQLTDYTDRSVRQVSWHPDGSILFFAADREGDEFHQLFRIDAGSREITQLTDAPDVQHFLAGEACSPDGRYLAFAANDDERTNQDVSLLDLGTGQVRRVLALQSMVLAGTWSADSTRLTAVDVHSNSDYRPHVVDVAGGESRELMPDHTGIKNEPVGLLPDHSALVVATDLDRDFVGLASVSLDDGTLSWLATPDWDVEQAALSADGSRLVWTVNVDGNSQLYARELESGQDLTAPALPPGMVSQLSVSRDGRQVALLVSTATRPTNLALVDLDGGDVTWLTDVRPATVDADSMTEPRLIRYATHDGRKVAAYLYRPAGDGPFPVVLSIHGGPEAQERPVYAYAGLYQYLLSRGIGVLAPNVRGSTGYGTSYQRLIMRDWGGAELGDFEQAAAYLRSLEWIDRDRIGVFGASFGGFAVLSCLSRLPDLWAVGVDIVGPSNLVTLAGSVPPTWRRMMTEWVGHAEDDKDFLVSRSPVTYADGIVAPLLVIQGANDPRVRQAESDQIVERLRSRGVDVRYDVYADEGHGFTKADNEAKALTDSADFLVKHLIR